MKPRLRARLPAFAVAGVVNALFVWLLIGALQVQIAPKSDHSARSETTITLTPLPAILPPKKRLRRPAGAGSTAITTPYFNPDTFALAAPRIATGDAIMVALSACDPSRYDMASREVRRACDRIGLALKNDPGHFGVTQDVADSKHWQRELARREAPYLAPCMSPGGFDALYTLYCISEVVFGGYDSENRPRYSDVPTSAPSHPAR